MSYLDDHDHMVTRTTRKEKEAPEGRQTLRGSMA